MFTPLIIRRYLGSRRGFTRVVTLFSVLGILLGVAALVMVLAVMGGFREELMNRILGVTGHATIEITDLTADNAESLAARLRAEHGISSAEPYVNGQALVSVQGRSMGALVRGVVPERLAPMLTKNLITAQKRNENDPFILPEGHILVGTIMARNLGILPGQNIRLLSPDGARTIAGFVPRTQVFTVAGIFDVGMVQFDSGLIIAPIQDAMAFAGTRGRVSAVEVKLTTPEAVDNLKPTLYKLADNYAPTPLDIRLTTWHDTNRDFFNALQVERVTMFIILSLIIIVAAFNIISGQMMLVNDKLADIAILRTMGATQADIRNIFLFNGLLLGGMGTVGGLLVGALGVWNMDAIVNGIQALTGIRLFPGDVYFLTELPGRLNTWDMAAVVGMSLVLTLLASLWPALRASRFQPVELLRR